MNIKKSVVEVPGACKNNIDKRNQIMYLRFVIYCD